VHQRGGANLADLVGCTGGSGDNRPPKEPEGRISIHYQPDSWVFLPSILNKKLGQEQHKATVQLVIKLPQSLVMLASSKTVYF